MPAAPHAAGGEPAAVPGADAVRLPSADGGRRIERLWLPLALTLLCTLWIALFLRRGWVPHDEGTLIQAAQRVNWGELPHRDYIDVYTGGLAFLDALAFRVFGETLLAPRLVLLLVAAGWIPALYVIARRFVPPTAAAGVTLCAVAWSVPNYTGAMPSWFCLFLATFGAAALLRYLDIRRTRWLAVAGACAGVSVDIKIVGLYFLAAGVLALLFVEQSMVGDADEDAGASRGGTLAWRLLLLAGLGGFILALLALIRPRMGAPEVFHFVVPGAAVAASILWNERNAPALPFGRRLARALRMLGPLLLGFAVPVALLAAVYAVQGALGDLVYGVLVLPFRRLSEAAMRPPGLASTLEMGLPLILALALPVRTRLHPAVRAAIWIAAAAFLAWTPRLLPAYGGTFLSMRGVIPLAVLAGCGWLVARPRPGQEPRRAAAMVVFATAALCGLVQYPFSAAVYFCYVAPLGVLAAAAAFSLNPSPARSMATLALVYLTAFAVLYVNRSYVWSMGRFYVASDQTIPLREPIGGGIRVRPHDARIWEPVSALMRAHAGGSRWAWAGPDTPELYPLSGLRNPTRNLFEQFDDQATFEPDLLRTLEARRVNVVVLNDNPPFSRPLSPPTRAAIEARYPNARRVGPMVVRWRA